MAGSSQIKSTAMHAQEGGKEEEEEGGEGEGRGRGGGDQGECPSLYCSIKLASCLSVTKALEAWRQWLVLSHNKSSPPFCPWITLTTPSGTPASCAIFTSIMQAPGSCSLGLITYVLPHTRAMGNICETRGGEGGEGEGEEGRGGRGRRGRGKRTEEEREKEEREMEEREREEREREEDRGGEREGGEGEGREGEGGEGEGEGEGGEGGEGEGGEEGSMVMLAETLYLLHSLLPSLPLPLGLSHTQRGIIAGKLKGVTPAQTPMGSR